MQNENGQFYLENASSLHMPNVFLLYLNAQIGNIELVEYDNVKIWNRWCTEHSEVFYLHYAKNELF